jgi:hypothetical protein
MLLSVGYDAVLSLLGKIRYSSEGSAAMWEKFKQTWRHLKAANPGQRFQQEFRRCHSPRRSPIQKALLIVGGLLLMAAGFLLLFIPGPGLVFLFVGGFLIAQQSLVAARVLDWSEIRLRKLLAWSLRA